MKDDRHNNKSFGSQFFSFLIFFNFFFMFFFFSNSGKRSRKKINRFTPEGRAGSPGPSSGGGLRRLSRVSTVRPVYALYISRGHLKSIGLTVADHRGTDPRAEDGAPSRGPRRTEGEPSRIFVAPHEPRREAPCAGELGRASPL